MTQLFVLALALAIFLHQEDPGVSQQWALSGWEWLATMGLAPLALALLYAMAARAARRNMHKHWMSVQRWMERCTGFYRAVILGLYVLALHAGLYDALRQATGRVILAADILFMMPPILLTLWSWWCYYPIDRELRSQVALSRGPFGGIPAAIWTRRQFITAQFRHQIAFVLAPVLALLGWQELIDGLAAKVTWLSAAMSTGAMLAGAGCLVVFAPVMIRRIWDTTPLPPGGTRDLLTGLCQQYKVRVRELLLWRTFGGMVNAAVMGFLAPFRYILLTDALLEHTPPEHVEAVMVHELAHIRKHHIFWLGAAAAGLLMLLALGWSAALAGADWGWAALNWSRPAWLVEMVETLLNPRNASIIAAVGALVCVGLSWTWVSRRFERQADTFAVQHLVRRAAVTGEASPRIDAHSVAIMVGALQQVADLNCISVTRRSWRHGSILWRQRYLQTLVGRPVDGLAIDRCVFWIKVGAVAAIVAAAGLNYWLPG